MSAMTSRGLQKQSGVGTKVPGGSPAQDPSKLRDKKERNLIDHWLAGPANATG
jgi:hypothetical protein